MNNRDFNRKIEAATTSSYVQYYQHHSYEEERETLKNLLLQNSTPEDMRITITTYSELLASDELRAVINGLISFVTLICRIAIEISVDMEKSFSTSDFFLNEIERCQDIEALDNLVEIIVRTYIKLVQEGNTHRYSYLVSKMIRYINSSIYTEITTANVSEHLNLNSDYLGRIFRLETHQTITQYIHSQKIYEAKKLLLDRTLMVQDISDILSFSSYNYFSKVFKKVTGYSPLEFRSKNII